MTAPPPPPPTYPTPTVPPLRVGSPEARAIYEVMCGRELVTIPDIDGRPAISAAVRLARTLLDQRPQAAVMFLADTLDLRGRYTSRLRRQFDPQHISPFTTVYQGQRPPWLAHGNVRRGMPPVWVASPDQPKGILSCHVMVVLAEFVTTPMTVVDPDVRAAQIVVLGTPAPEVLRACDLAAGFHPRLDWGEVPLDVLLAATVE